MERLPGESAVFAEKKQRILRQLSLPEAAYTDASPKGSVDEGIRQLIDDINGVPGFVTTSSCAGRISVFVEGRKSAPASAEPGDQPQRQGAEESTTFKPASSSGGKGGGGRWLFVSHEPVQLDDGTGARIASILGLGDAKEGCEVQMGQNHEKRLIHFKFEPMVSWAVWQL